MNSEPTKVVMIAGKPVSFAARSSTVSHLSTPDLRKLGDHLDHVERQVPSDLLLDCIHEQRLRTAAQQEIAENAIASNRKRRALLKSLQATRPATVETLDPEILAQMRRDQAERKARKKVCR
jgi:hypothetical protein